MSSKEASFSSNAEGPYTPADFNQICAQSSSSPELFDNDSFRDWPLHSKGTSISAEFADGASPSGLSGRAASYSIGDFHQRALNSAVQYYMLSDANQGKQGAKGHVAMDATGNLSVVSGPGELFRLEVKGWVYDEGKMVGQYYTFRSKSHPLYYLAVDTNSQNFTVKGMQEESLAHPSDCYWRWESFAKIIGAKSSPYISLQYWGNYFQKPDIHKNQYFLLIKDEGKEFVIGPKDKAADYGALGVTS